MIFLLTNQQVVLMGLIIFTSCSILCFLLAACCCKLSFTSFRLLAYTVCKTCLGKYSHLGIVHSSIFFYEGLFPLAVGFYVLRKYEWFCKLVHNINVYVVLCCVKAIIHDFCQMWNIKKKLVYMCQRNSIG